MTRDTRIALLLIKKLVAALHRQYPDAFECWMFGGIQGIVKTVVVELLLD